MSATCEAPVPDKLDKSHLRIEESVKWSDLPAEVIGNVMQYLGPAELKIFRGMHKKSSAEATRYLFHTLVFKPTDPKEFEQVSGSLRGFDCSFVKHVKTVKHYRGVLKWHWTLQEVMTINRGLTPVMFLSAEMRLDDAKYLFSEALECRSEVAYFLSNIKEIRMLFAQVPSLSGDPDVLRGYRELPKRLPNVQDLELGFTKGHLFGVASNEAFHVQGRKHLTKAMLHDFFPKITTLKLNNIVASRDDLLSFLKRHKANLEHLSFQDLHLVMPTESTSDSYNVLSWSMQFFLLLKQELILKEVCFRGSIEVHGQKHGWRKVLPTLSFENEMYGYETDGWPTQILHDGSMLPKTETLRYKLQEFICHRGDFPWENLRPYLEGIAEGSFANYEHAFTIQSETGSWNLVFVETDDTWYLDFDLDPDHDGRHF